MRLNFSRLPAPTLALGLVALSTLLTTPAHSQIAPGTGRFKTNSSTKSFKPPQPAPPSTKEVTTGNETTNTASSGTKPQTVQATNIPKQLLGTDISFSRTALIQYSVVNDTKTDTILIHNSGSPDFTLSTMPISGPNVGDFSVSGCHPNIVSANTSDCALTVTYSPKDASTASYATLTVNFAHADGSALSSPLSQTFQLSGYPAVGCSTMPGYLALQKHWFIPLTHKDIDDNTINCYYNTTSNFAFATQVAYQYSPSGSANTVAADLLAFQFPGGVQLALEGNASAASCPSTPTAAGTSATSTSCGTSSGSGSAVSTTPTLAQDIQTLEEGGDFALKATYPLISLRGNKMQLLSFATPRVGFTVNGLSATTTTTNATDINFNLSNESYGQLDALPNHTGGDAPASLFFDYRWGLEHISSTYAQNAGLQQQSNFLLQQVQAGIVITGAVKISATRYVGPSQVYVDSTGKTVSAGNNFGNWQLSVQITPSSVSSN